MNKFRIFLFLVVPLLICFTRLAVTSAGEQSNANARQPVFLLEGTGEPNGNGTGYLKVAGSETLGAYSLIERIGPIGGPDPHTHNAMEEAWYVLDGQIHFDAGGTQLTAEAGAFVLVPRGTTHRFWGEDRKPVRYLMVISPPGFERYFNERMEIPGRDPSTSAANQSPEFKAKARDLARTYGIGDGTEPHEEKKPLVVFRDPAAAQRTVVGTEITHGAYTLTEATTPPGKSAPVTAAPEMDVAWYVVDGELTFERGGQTWKGKRAAFFFSPRGQSVHIRATSIEPARYLVFSSTSGAR